MAEHHMSAREAWGIVQAGHPGAASVAFGKPDGVRYARACAIVEALVHAHEGLGESSDYDVPIRTAKVRALERGDELPSVDVRALAAQERAT